MPSDGFLGLAFSTIGAPNTTTVVETLMQHGLIDEPRFGIYYGKNFDNTSLNPEGVLTIGGSKEDLYVDGPVTYIPLRVESEYQVWRTPLRSISGTKAAASSPIIKTFQIPDGRAVFDTGAGGMQIPTDQIYDLYESIGFNYTALLNGYIPPCTDFNSSWSVTFNFGTDDSADSPRITLSGDELARPGFANSELACFPPFEDTPTAGFALLGTPFLHRFYSIWDFGDNSVANYQPRVGFGKLKVEYRP
jgi:saccharopepsin